MGRLLTPGEVAERLRVTRHTLANWRSLGIGPPAFRVGASVRYDETAVEQWLRDRRRLARRGTAT